MAGNPVAANLVMALCLIGGLVVFSSIKQEVFPEFTADEVRVSVSYPGASPEEVEEGIILPIEEAVQSIDNVKEITSTANENVGTVTLEAISGTDIQQLVDDVQNEVDRITTFPDEAKEPEVRAPSHRHGVLNILLYGDVDRKILHTLGENVRDQLLQDNNITQVELSGLPELEITISITQENLRRYGLTLGEVAAIVKNRAVDLPCGNIDTKSGEILVRMKERLDYGKEFALLPIINTSDGSEVLLGDIATVADGFEETDRYTLYNGKNAIELEVYRVGKQTPIQVEKAVFQKMESISVNFPAGLNYAVFHNMAEIYKQRANLLLKNGAIGLVLVLLLLGIFLEARLAFWVMMGIPISFLGSFLLLPVFNISINMMSMFAYIVALGIVVDDAIVVGENVYSYHQKGYSFMKSAIYGVQEVAMPVTFSVLTNIAAFMPLYFIPGVMGKIFGVIPVVVCSTFMISLFECLFILPAHLGHYKERRRNRIYEWLHQRQQSFSHAFKNWVNNRYGNFLNFVLKHRYLTFAIALSILILAIGYAASGRMGMTLFPDSESDYASVELAYPYGTPVEKTEKTSKKLVAAAQKLVEESGYEELLKGILVDVGRGGSHQATVRALLAGPKVRDKIMSTAEFARKWREKVGEIPGTEYVKFESAGGGPGHRNNITVELRHRDMEVLKKVSSELADELKEYPIVSQVNDGFQPGKSQFDLKMKPEGQSLGLTAQSTGQQIRDAFYGARALVQLRGRNEVEVRVKLPEEQRSSAYYLEKFMVKTPADKFIPLQDIAETKRSRGYIIIERRNGSRVIQVTGDATPSSKAGEVLADLKKNTMPTLIRKYPNLSYSFEGRRADIRESMSSLQVTFLLAILIIYAMLAIPFRSYVQPLIVMTSIPFGIVGAILGHLLMGYSLSVVSLFGVVALSGIVINDSLVLITFANRLRIEKNVSAKESICEATIQRFRPVVLTSLTTFGGLAPLIFENSRQARMMVPMAISLGFGILFALLITLVLVPSLYLMVKDVESD